MVGKWSEKLGNDRADWDEPEKPRFSYQARNWLFTLSLHNDRLSGRGNVRKWSHPLDVKNVSLTRQTSLLWRLSFHEESLPFVKPKIGSPLGNRPHLNFPFRRTRSSTRFCRKRDGSRYFLGTLGWNPNSCPKTSGWRHCKSLIFLDSHWTWHKPYCSKSNVVHSIYMSAHTTSIN